MHFNIYDNIIIVPNKCGSRYMDSIYDIPIDAGFPSDKILPKVTHNLTPFAKLNLNGIKWIVMRPPIDLLTSAIHTELILNWTRNPNNVPEKDIIHNLRYSDWNCAHYQFNLYKEMFLKSMDYTDIIFVKLEDLSAFCELELNYHKRYKLSNFDFSVINGFKITKNTCMEYVKLRYPYYYSSLMGNIPIDDIFYNLIINSNRLWKEEHNENYQKRYKKIL